MPLAPIVCAKLPSFSHCEYKLLELLPLAPHSAMHSCVVANHGL